MRCPTFSLVLGVALHLGCTLDEGRSGDETRKTKASASPSARAASASPAASSAPPTAVTAGMPTAFARTSVDVMNATSVDACSYLGGLGMACLNALAAEKDPVKKRYMRRLSDADARLAHDAYKRGEPNGLAHPEIAMTCAASGPCKQKDAEGNEQDDGYACLTKAETLLTNENDAEGSANAHKRACSCDPDRAQIPVMGGFLACDGKDKPVTRGQDLGAEEARRIRACAECQPETGPAACMREVASLQQEDAALATYIETVHARRCALP